VLQLSVLVLGPGHFLPLPEGGGLVQVRFLTRTPPPQVLSQGPGLLQGDQLPSTPGLTQTDKPKPVITNSGIAKTRSSGLEGFPKYMDHQLE